MTYFRANGTEFSPCIISKVRFELGITKIRPNNSKECSDDYWNEAVIKVAIYNRIPKAVYTRILRDKKLLTLF